MTNASVAPSSCPMDPRRRLRQPLPCRRVTTAQGGEGQPSIVFRLNYPWPRRQPFLPSVEGIAPVDALARILKQPLTGEEKTALVAAIKRLI